VHPLVNNKRQKKQDTRSNGGGGRKYFNMKNNDNSTSVAAGTGRGHRNYSENTHLLASDAISVGEHRIIVPPSAGK
jgi:hypothetical protein